MAEADRYLAALLAAPPLFLAGISCWLTGWLTPRQVKRFGDVARVRRSLGATGCALACLILQFSGWMNTWGCLGGLLAPWTIPYILQAAGNDWAVVIQVIAGWYFVGALSWLGIDPVTPADRTESPAEQNKNKKAYEDDRPTEREYRTIPAGLLEEVIR